MRFWEQFESSVDSDTSLSTINKHVFLRGYLEGEPTALVDGIAITASTYEETKNILKDRYGDNGRIIQTHLDFLEDLKPTSFSSPESLNATFIECNQKIHEVQALGEDINGYGRVLAPKILRAFPDEFCRRWIVHIRRERISEGDILKLMQFLNDEVNGALINQKIRGEPMGLGNYTPTAATLQVQTRTKGRAQKTATRPEPFCVFCENRGHWAQDCRSVSDVDTRIAKLKAANRCFLCLNRGHNSQNCGRKGRALCTQCRGSHH